MTAYTPSVDETAAQDPEDDASSDHRRSADGAGRGSAWLAFLLPALVAAACVVPGLGGRQLWRDEHATWWASTISWHDLGRLIGSIDVVIAPYYAAMHLWIDVAGDSAAMLRLPEALAMAVSAGLVGLLGRRMFAVRTGVLAGLLFAVVPMITRYGQEARPYAFATMFALLATLWLIRALDKPSLRNWTLYGLAIAATGFSHLVAMAVLAGHVWLVFLAKKRGDRIAHYAFAGAALLGLSITFPMVAQGTGQSGQIAWNVTTTKDLTQFPDTLFGSWITGGAVMALGVVGLMVAGRYSVLLAAWAVLPPVLTFATANQLHLFLPRYLLFTIPAWTLLVAAALTRLVGRLDPEARRGTGAQVLSGLLVAAVAAGYAFVAWPAIGDAKKDLPMEPDFRGAANVVAAGEKPGDGMVFNGGMSERRAMAYELRDRKAPKDVLMEYTPQENGSYGATECRKPASCLKGTDRLWLISTVSDGRPPLTGMNEKTAAAIEKSFKAGRTVKLNHIVVRVLERK
ncbi:MAG: glycosyltransferase family 39 protein [Streptomyces sp.]|uniref:glycosyltransferase family 39 protein n=1 Tax=Streptomyces sp. TaxID=1931 RepID=UPI0025E6192D|nr:glycosyltransferase family 39 protein [Streptomyces sp.]MBW8801678.1 glycosyltransferase family 39 protein [Streptomyces sp.]